MRLLTSPVIVDLGGCKPLRAFSDLQQNPPTCAMHLRRQSIRGVLGMAGRRPWPFGDLCLHWRVRRVVVSLGTSALLFLPKWRDLGDWVAPVVFAWCSPRGALLDNTTCSSQGTGPCQSNNSHHIPLKLFWLLARQIKTEESYCFRKWRQFWFSFTKSQKSAVVLLEMWDWIKLEVWNWGNLSNLIQSWRKFSCDLLWNIIHLPR